MGLFDRSRGQRCYVDEAVAVRPAGCKFRLVFLCVLLVVLVFYAGYFIGSGHKRYMLVKGVESIANAEHDIRQMESSAVASHVKALEAENAKLKEDLAVYNLLEKSSYNPTAQVSIGHLDAKKVSIGLYEYNILLVRDRRVSHVELPVKLRFEATVSNDNGERLVPVEIKNMVPPIGIIRLSFFHKLNGKFQVDDSKGHLKGLTVFVCSGKSILAERTFSFH